MFPVCVHALFGYCISSKSFKCIILSFNTFFFPPLTFKECMFPIKCSMNAYVTAYFMLHIMCWTIKTEMWIQSAKLSRKWTVLWTNPHCLMVAEQIHIFNHILHVYLQGSVHRFRFVTAYVLKFVGHSNFNLDSSVLIRISPVPCSPWILQILGTGMANYWHSIYSSMCIRNLSIFFWFNLATSILFWTIIWQTNTFESIFKYLHVTLFYF
jgi:hypothetical protein